LADWYENFLTLLTRNAQYLVLGVVIVIVSYIAYHEIRRLTTWLREQKKLPQPIIDTFAPVLKYSTIIIGFTVFLLNISNVFEVYDDVYMFIPSIMIGSFIVIVTWFSYQVIKYTFSWLRVQKRVPFDILNVIELVIKYGVVVLGCTFLILNFVATTLGSELVITLIFGWFTTHGGRVVLIIASLIFIRIITKFLGTFFEDLKWRTSFQPDIIDLAGTSTRFLIYLVVGLMVLSSLLTIMGAEELLPLLTSIFSVLFGVGFSFAAAGAIGNFIAGLVLSNWKPYDVGDRVELGNNVHGDVMEFDVLFTKVKTIKEEIISVPNLAVLTNKIMNYSSLGACVIHSSIGVGYEYPRKTVEDLLIKAAHTTEDVLSDPSPFVFIPELANYVVIYEINGYTDKPNQLAKIYSDLHKNILDIFHEASIPLISPTIVELTNNKEARA
jgi:small-conductance mechanosensitive channel